MDKKIALSISDLQKLYRNGRGVSRLSLSVAEGEVVGLLGPNGSGKTTAMKAAVGLSRIGAGSISIFGHDIDGEFEKAMYNVGCLIETPALYDKLSAKQNLKIAARFYDYPDSESRKNAINEALTLVGLEKYSRDKVGSFSLGMRQRLGIALALISRPGLVILDEPTNGLDIEGVVHIRNVIRDMAEKLGTAFLISGHVASELEKLCDRVTVIYDGKMCAEGTVDSILEKYPSLEDYFLAMISEAKERGEGA